VTEEQATNRVLSGFGLWESTPEDCSRQDRYECARTGCEHHARQHGDDGCSECPCLLSRALVITEVEALWPGS
jgi:hypothetical protein